MLEDTQSPIAKSVITFIDIILDLYSPVPHEIRNQMRVLQSTLLYSRKKQLEEYIQSLKEKLQLKERNKHQRLLSEAAVPVSIADKSPLRRQKNPLTDSDKENKFYLNNLRINTSQNLKSKENSFNISTGQMDKNRKISAVQYLNRQDEELNELKEKKTLEMPRTACRTLLKIVKKSRSSKQKDPLTARSLEQVSKSSVQILKTNIAQILEIMDSNQANFILESSKNRFQLD